MPDNNPNWKIRVIENLYPALSRELADPDDETGSVSSVLDGFGFHDVVIETPDHDVVLSDLEREGIGEVFVAYCDRILELGKRNSIRYVQVCF